MLHTRAVIPFKVPLEVNIILVGFRGDGGFRYSLDIHKLEAFLKLSFPTHRPACLETGELIGIEHRLSYNVFPAGQQELIALERAMKKAMVPAGTARERLYSYTFDMNGRGGKSTEDMIRSVPSAIIVVNFDKVQKMVSAGQEVVVIGGSHSLHHHEKLAIAVYKAMRGQSVQASKPDGSFHVHTKTYLDGSILKEEMERSGDMLAAGLLEVSDPSLLHKFFLHQIRMENSDGSSDSFIKHQSIQETDRRKRGNMKKKDKQKKLGYLYRTYGTRVIPVFVLSLANIDENLLMEDESLVWTSKDVVIVLQHQTEKIPLSYVSETERRYAFPLQARRHIIAGLASAVGGLTAPYEKVSQIHERPMLNWLWAAVCHPFGPFSNTSEVSHMLQDVALRRNVYSRVDAALNRIRDTSESLEEQLVNLSSLLYDLRLKEADLNSTNILESTFNLYVDHILVVEREKIRCCELQYEYPESTYQALICAVGIVVTVLCVYLVILFSNPVR
ncbi:hypothetical protein MKX03_011561 [Papaver bracteatum]|nr:hypothetical protein MKX03_011561 [Papaver bracteatum]